jgi:hypothetical protein
MRKLILDRRGAPGRLAKGRRSQRRVKVNARCTGPGAAALAGAVALAMPASGGPGPAVWSFDLASSGGDVFWTSPSAVNPGAALFQATHQIALVEVDVTFLGIPFNNIDVTSQLPPELLAGSSSVAGPAPVVLVDQPVQYPDPPEAVCLAAHLVISLDGLGFGQAQMTGVDLGLCQVDLGFGLVTVTLQGVRVVGQITVTADTCPWDADGDGEVAITDFLEVLAAWGSDPGGPPDSDADGIVGIADFLAVLANWGPCPG